mgnify:CR=1 FL=1
MDNLLVKQFSEINLNDPFFDSLKKDYSEFSEWFNKKSDQKALVLYSDQGRIEGFLYCKFERGHGSDTTPLLPNKTHMKVGTFKFNPMGTRRGDRYLKKIFDYAISKNADDIYVTVFADKHRYLVDLFSRYGFEHYGTKNSNNGTELVLLRDLSKNYGDVDMDYPFININGCKKALLSIYPKYHTRLFPDSKLFTESPNIVTDISHSNSIHKLYICKMDGVSNLSRGDILVIYRTGDGQGPAEYRSVATSLCVVENINTLSSYQNEEHFVNECSKFSVFSEKELREIYQERKYNYVINFTYNIALPKRPIRQALADVIGLDRYDYWGFMELTDEQFLKLLEISDVDGRLIRY